MALLSCAALHESSSGANRLCRSQDALGPAVLTSGTTSSYTYSHTSASACRLQRTGSSGCLKVSGLRKMLLALFLAEPLV